MAIPTWSVGQVLTASDVNNWLTGTAVYKTSTTVRNTLTLTNDPDLVLPVSVANAVYEIRGIVIYTASAGSFKWTFTVPSGATGGYSVVIPQATPVPLGEVWTAAIAGATDGTTYAIQIQGILLMSSTTGNLILQWASNSGPNTITVGIGSYLASERVG